MCIKRANGRDIIINLYVRKTLTVCTGRGGRRDGRFPHCRRTAPATAAAGRSVWRRIHRGSRQRQQSGVGPGRVAGGVGRPPSYGLSDGPLQSRLLPSSGDVRQEGRSVRGRRDRCRSRQRRRRRTGDRAHTVIVQLMVVSGDRSQMMVMIKHGAWNVKNVCSSTQKSAEACMLQA